MGLGLGGMGMGMGMGGMSGMGMSGMGMGGMAGMGGMGMANQLFMAQPYWDQYAQQLTAQAQQYTAQAQSQQSAYGAYGTAANGLGAGSGANSVGLGSGLASGMNNAAALQALYGNYGLGMGAAAAAPTSGVGSNKEGPPGANLFVYHLPKEYTDSDLVTMFSPYGPLESCKIITDKDTGLSRCFGMFFS